MTLCSLIYASRRVSAEPSDLLESIHASAERNNALLGVTGALVFDHRGFVQLLEGCRANVTDMFLRIAQDPRHEDFHLLGVRDTPKRQFPQWSMHHAAIRGSGPVSARAYMPHAEFEPSNLSTDGAMALFEEVAHLARMSEHGAA